MKVIKKEAGKAAGESLLYVGGSDEHLKKARLGMLLESEK